MTEKNIKARIVHKHDVESNWIKATGFAPLLGEIVIYDSDETHPYSRIKIGDGETNINDLPFIDEHIIQSIIGQTTEWDDIKNKPDFTDILKYSEQELTEEQKTQARGNIGAVSEEDVREIIEGGSEKEFNETGELVKLEIEHGTPISVVSKIHRDSTWGLSNKLVLYQVSGSNFVDFTTFLGGVGTTFSKNGLTATVNNDSTITIQGTNESTGWTNLIEKHHWSGEPTEKVYPAGTYKIPSGFMMNVRSAKYPDNITIEGVGSNLQGTVTIPEPFRIVVLIYPVAGSKTVDVTVPLGLFYEGSIPETDYEYLGNIYSITFNENVYEGEFNWSTGELKDINGNTINYYDTTDITTLHGTNYFWTGFGENIISNKKNEGNIILRMNETAPEGTIASICDFTFTPTTMNVGYNLYYQSFLPNNPFYGTEVPIFTTKGTLSVKDINNNIKYSKYIEPMFNKRGIKDIFTEVGMTKRWSEKYYLTKSPISTEHIPPQYSWNIDNYLFTWEFEEDEFISTGIPAKIHDIPIASVCFINDDESENKVNTAAIYGGTPYPAFFSYNKETGKYILKARGIRGGEINKQLTEYSKVYFYYELETPYEKPFSFAMGIEAGDTITFNSDLEDLEPYMEKSGLFQTLSGEVTEFNVDPSIVAFVPQDIKNAMNGMSNAATILNSGGYSATENDTVQEYDWIGDANESIDYTNIIQNKINEVYKLYGKGNVHIGKGTYKISDSLILYNGIYIIGQGESTVIEQTADHTHGIIVSGSNIGIEKLSIKLIGNCDGTTPQQLSYTMDNEVIGCIYINSYNTPNLSKWNPKYPENYYCQNILIRDVKLFGKYAFDYSSGTAAYPSNKDTYKGCGIFAPRSYFNYAHIDNVHMDCLFAGYYGSGGSNIVNMYCTGSKIMVCDICGGYNIFNIKGHTYYSNGISLSKYALYSNGEYNTYNINVYDNQWFTNIAYFDTYSMNNKYHINQFSGGYIGFSDGSPDLPLREHVKNLGRGNVNIEPFVNTPFHLGSRYNNLTGQTEFKPTDAILENALSGAGVWGSVTSNINWEGQLTLSEVCRYPKVINSGDGEICIRSSISPSVENPIEITIDVSNRPIIAFPNLFIQFNHNYVAEDFSIEFYTANDTLCRKTEITNNNEVVCYCNFNQEGYYKLYKIKIIITKALEIDSLDYRSSDYTAYSIHYNPNKLVGICNIGMTSNEYAGRAFLGAYGDSMYGKLDMDLNQIKNVGTPTDEHDSVNKLYVDNKFDEINIKLSSVYNYKGSVDYYMDLPENSITGDVYKIEYDSSNGFESGFFEKYYFKENAYQDFSGDYLSLILPVNKKTIDYLESMENIIINFGVEVPDGWGTTLKKCGYITVPKNESSVNNSGWSIGWNSTLDINLSMLEIGSVYSFIYEGDGEVENNDFEALKNIIVNDYNPNTYDGTISESQYNINGDIQRGYDSNHHVASAGDLAIKIDDGWTVLPINTNIYTKEQIDSKGYLTEQDISEKANKSDVYTKEEVNNKLSSVYKYKGTKDYYFELPTNAEIGDVYNIRHTSGEGYYDEKPKTYTEWNIWEAAIPPFANHGLSGFYIRMGFDSKPDFMNGETLNVGVYSPSYFSTMTGFTVPILDSCPYPATSCAYYDGSYLYIFVVDSEDPFSNANQSGYNTKYDEIYDYIINHPWNPDENPQLRFNNEVEQIVQLREPYIVNAGDNVAWTGSEWDVLAGTIDTSNFITKADVSNKIDDTEINPVSGKAVDTAIKNAISAVYRFKGSVSIDAINAMYSLSKNIGDVYNIIDSGTIEDREVSVMGTVLSVDSDGLTVIRANDSSLNELRNQFYTTNVIIGGASENYNVVGTSIDSSTNTVKFFVQNLGLEVGSLRPMGYILKGFDVIEGDNISWTGSYWDKLSGTIDLSNYYTKEEVESLIQTAVQEYVQTAILNGEW